MNRTRRSGILLPVETCPFDFGTPNFPLADETLYGVGGPAQLALRPRARDEVIQAFRWMCRQGLPTLVLGGGSNALIRDGGFPGIVLLTDCLNQIEELGQDRCRIGAGVDLPSVVRDLMVPRNYKGTGGLTGIPGSVGGAIYMNAGTVKGSICQLMTSVDVVTRDGAKTVTMSPDLYGYRGQTFCAQGDLILGGEFQFEVAEDDQRVIYDHYMRRRREKHPPGKSCGSVFKNPEGDHAGRLIEACGLKGVRHGGAVISPMHANFIINDANARCADILALIDLCKCTVKERFGLDLEEEVRIFGIDAPASL